MDCNVTKNLDNCTCSYDSCPRRGKCCECVIYHRKNGELPGCFFPPEAERSYDRSIRKFISCFKS